MKLKEIEVKNYKIIDDTNPVKIDPRVTALVGKNESGKSSILKALWKSRSVADAKFDKLLDYPRDRYAAERKGTQVVSVLTFELTPGEIDHVVKEFKLDPHHPPKSVIYTTSYLGEDKTKREVNFEEGLEQHTGADAKAAIAAALATIASSTDAATVVTASTNAIGRLDADQPVWTKANLAALEDFSSTLTAWATEEGNTEKAVRERDAVTNLFNEAKQGDPYIPVSKWIENQLPFFIYFDDYGQLETRIHLPTYIRKRGTDDPKARTQTALFEWSHLDPEEILQLGAPRRNEESEEAVIGRQEKRRALLASASFSLSGDWVKWWTEKRHKLHFDADGEDLVLQVSDDQNPFPVPFEERSHGFQWFFSFYLVFSVESKKAHKNSILLLDEPGLHLHPTLQSKLIELFERITDADQQLIYTTHLPFLIDGSHLERVRTVYLTGDEPQKAVVSNDVRPTGDRDTLFPLQAVVGYSIAQTLFLGEYPVIVEGITDYWLIKTLDNCLSAAEGEQTLNPGTILVPAGGTSRLMPLASIMLASTGERGNRLAVLLDSDKVGGEAAKRFQDAFDTSASVLMLGPAIGLTEATIEDLIPREDYVERLNMLGYRFTLNAAENAAPTNVKAMELAFDRAGLGKFETSQRAQVALSFMDVWGKRPGVIPADTKSKALALFSAINRAFGKKAAPKPAWRYRS